MAKQKLNGELEAGCPVCNEVHILDAWDNMTESQCLSRKMRRDYVSCKELRAYDKNNRVYYTCPSCQKLIQARNFKIETEDTEVRKLCNKPIIQNKIKLKKE